MDDSWPGPQQQFHVNNSSVRLIDPVIVPSTNNNNSNNNNNRAKTSDSRKLQKHGNQEPSIASLPSTIQTGQSQSNQSGYVLRGGFKMPRQPSAGGNNRLD